jgi:hypothetical protein
MSQFENSKYRYCDLNGDEVDGHVFQGESMNSRPVSPVDSPLEAQQLSQLKTAYVQANEQDPGTSYIDGKSSREILWHPRSLHRTTLGIFVGIFFSILAVLEVLKQYSDRHQGLTTTTEGKHYLWTYGPTAS